MPVTTVGNRSPSPASQMPRPRNPEQKHKLSTYVPKSLHDAMLDFHVASGISITRIMEDALREYLASRYWVGGKDEEMRGGRK